MYIAVSGKKGSGKTTLANALQAHWSQRGMAVLRYSLAEPIAQMAQAVYAVGRHYGIEAPPNGKDSDLMQALGDEWGNRKDPEIWIKAAKTRLAQATTIWEEKGLFYIVILERVCHPNQLAAWPDAYTVRLVAPEEVRKQRCVDWPTNPNHSSETGLDGHKFDVQYDTSAHDVSWIVENIALTVTGRFNRGHT